MTPDEQTLAGDPGDSEPPPSGEQAMSTFDEAQQKFHDGDYQAALTSVDAAIKEMPNDAVLHEFRALTLFALAKYQDAAATLYPVLSVGPGWDWTTMSSLYPEVDVYTSQLRKLEEFRDDHPSDSAARFVLAYHYMTCGHREPAAEELRELTKRNPKDQLVVDLLQQAEPEAEIPKQPAIVKPPEKVAAVDAKNIEGNWTAKRKTGETFEMSLDDSGQFEWKFTFGGQTQEVKGAYAVDNEGVLALEMNDQGTMLAQLDVKGSTMDFYMLGDVQGTEPLHFVKQ